MSFTLALLLYPDRQLDAAEATFHAIEFLLTPPAPRSPRVLGEIYSFEGDTKKAIRHLQIDLGLRDTTNV